MTDQAEDLKTLMKNKNSSDKAALSNIPPKRKTRIIAVTSGKGGVGKTNISTNMLLLMPRWEKTLL